MSVFNRYLHEYDIEVLKLYLDGETAKNIASKVYPDGWVGASGKTSFENSLKKCQSVLCMPWAKREAIKNKDGVLKNLEIHLAHKERLALFFKSEEQRLKTDGFTYYN
jgi:hypothetical protein